MPALDTVGQYLKEARVLLQDTDADPYRYSDTELVDALNIGILEARRLRADLFLPAYEVPYLNSGAIDINAKVPIDQMYRPALVYYIVGRAQLRDDEATTDSRAGAFLTKFTQQLLVVES